MSHPDPTREYGEHPDEPQHREFMRTQGYRQGHAKSKALKKRTDGKVSAVDASKAFDRMSKRVYKRLGKS